ncbi:MAG: O-antigen ligase family protein [Proteobacteria bacterium]|nr:O-antigen ligase family protein [Pseudomonadota bacterium]
MAMARLRDGTRVAISTYWFVCVYIFAACGALASLFASGESRGGAVYAALWAGLYALTALLYLGSKKAGFVLDHERGLFVFCFFVLLSFSWSEMPDATLVYSISIVSNIFFAIYCSRKFGLLAFLGVYVKVLNLTILVGLVLAMAGFEVAYYFDPLGRSNALGVALIKGLFSHKIYAGFYSAQALYLNIILLRGKQRFAFASLAFVAVLVSGSSVGLVAVLLGAALTVVLRRFRNASTRRQLLLPALFSLLMSILIGAVFYVDILGLLGRDASLTGRTDLWGWALQFWMDSPLVGWGYAGIFGDSPNAPSSIINDDSYYQAPHFHSGYLQVLAELGLIGFVFYVSLLVRSLLFSVRRYWMSGRDEDLAASVLLIMIAVVGFAMNIFMRYNELSSILIVLFYLILFSKRGSR